MKLMEMCAAGYTMDCYARHTSRYGKKGIPRGKNINPTTLSQEGVNRRRAIRQLRRLINHNFKPGDFHLVLGYKKELRPEDPKEARKHIQSFLGKLRRSCRKEGETLKYVWVLEKGSRGALHFHLVISETDLTTIRKAWTYGRPQIYPLDDTWNWSDLAEYLIKKGDRQTGRRYNPSRTLEYPKVDRWVMGRDLSEPKAKKGYYIDQDHLNWWITKEGYLSLEYVQVRLDAGKGG